MNPMNLQPFYSNKGAGVLATGQTAGPWNPAHQHGGPVSALLARALEAEAPPGFVPAFLWAELLKPVPVGYSEISVEPTRAGANVRGLKAVLRTIDRQVAQLSGTWVKTEENLPASRPERPGLSKAPDACEVLDVGNASLRGYLSAIEVRPVLGIIGEDSHVAAWLKLKTPLFVGETASPLVRLMALVDSCAGLANPVDMKSYTFLNADLSVRLHRLPISEWIGIDAESTSTTSGVGSSIARIYDVQGYLGSASQTLLIRPRAGAF
jgi:hypothetical protein